jgi:hypothetical protein
MKSRISVYVPGLLVLMGALAGGCGGEVEVPPGNSIPGATFTAPSEPSELVVTPGDGQVTVSWKAPALNGGKDITEYVVHALQGDTVRGEAKTNGGARSATVTRLTNGETYTVKVTARNSVGPQASVRSAEVVPRKVLGSPRDIVATPGNQRVTLSWTAPEDTGLPLAGYTVTMRVGEEEVIRETSDTTLTVTELENGRAYTFTVRASNGDGPGGLSGPVVVTPRTVSDAPRFSLQGADGYLLATWDVPANNGGSPITSYEVTVVNATTRESTTYTTAPTDPSHIRFEINGLVNGVVYEVTVTAINAAGRATADMLRLAPGAAPTALRNFRAVTGEPSNGLFTLDLFWEPPENDGGHALRRCDLTLVGGATTYRTQVSPTATSHSLGEWPTGRDYRITLVCENAYGTSPVAEVTFTR